MSSLPNYISDNLSSGRFAEKTEIVSKCEKAFLSEKKKSKASGVPVVVDLDNGLVNVDNSDTNNIVVSSTGTGKTTRILIPELLTIAYEGKSSVICNDPKGELYLHTSDLFRKQNYDVRVLNFRDCMSGDTYNPLYIMAKLYHKGYKSKAIDLMKAFADTLYHSSLHSEKDVFWETAASSYMTGLFILLTKLYEDDIEEINLYNLFDLHVRGCEKVALKPLINHYCEMPGVDELAYKFLSCAIDAPNDTKSSIFSVFTTGLIALVNNMDVVDMTASNSFEPENFVKRKTILYIISKDESRVYDNLITGIIDQFYTVFVDISNKYSGVLPRRIEMVIDEMANLSKINDIDRKISASRSRNIRWTLCIQSREQLDIVYGKDIAKVIISNCNNIFYLYSPDLELLEYLSRRCGNQKDVYTRNNEPLLSVERLQNFDEGECLVILGNLNPFVTYLPFCLEYPYTKLDCLKFKKRRRRKINTKQIKEPVEEMIREEKSKKYGDNDNHIFRSLFADDDTPSKEKEKAEIDKKIKEIDEKIKELESEESNKLRIDPKSRITNKTELLFFDEFLEEDDF